MALADKMGSSATFSNNHIEGDPFKGVNSSDLICPESLAQHMEHVATSRAYSPSARFTNHSYGSSDNIGLQERRYDNCWYNGVSYSDTQSDISLLRSSGSRFPSTATQRDAIDTRSFIATAPPPSSMMKDTSEVDMVKGTSEGSGGSTTGAPEYSDSAVEAQKKPNSQSKKWLIAGIILAVVALAIGIAIAVTLVTKHGVHRSGRDGSVVKQTNPNDPSSFIKNPNLHKAFYGIAYTPANSQLPNCGNSLKDVITDIQLLSQLTGRIRLYGADCNQASLVLEAIKRTKIDMQVWLGNYPIATDDGAAYQRQRDIIRDAISTYGTDHISGVTVGNEFMLNYLNANGGSTNPNSDLGNQAADILLANLQDTRDMLASMNLPKTIPVGTSDAGSYFNNKVLAGVDYGMANVHPWFGNVSIDASASWTIDFFQTVDVSQATAIPDHPQMYIAETGWPSKSSDAANESNGPSTANIANLQKFLDTFVCQANSEGIPYFYFELFDEPWKDQQFGGVEGWWGLFNSDRTLKGIKIPNCLAP